MKKLFLISLLVGMMGVIAFIGCERETISPNEGRQLMEPASFLVGEWVVNDSMSNIENHNYKDTILFTTKGTIEKHSILAGSRYVLLNDTTIRFECSWGNYERDFTYYPPNGIMFYNFWDNTLSNYIKNIYYERVRNE